MTITLYVFDDRPVMVSYSEGGERGTLPDGRGRANIDVVRIPLGQRRGSEKAFALVLTQAKLPQTPVIVIGRLQACDLLLLLLYCLHQDGDNAEIIRAIWLAF